MGSGLHLKRSSVRETLVVWGASVVFVLAGHPAEFRPPLVTADGFAVPQPGRRFEFPRDHGSHPDFKIEWWYVTGHVWDEAQRRYGFQATFFRRAGPRMDPASVTPPTTSTTRAFGTAELHLAHMALLDVGAGKFIHEERLNRRGWDAEARAETLDLRNGNWSLRLAEAQDESIRMALRGSIRAEAAFEFDLAPRKPLVSFGENGVSRKGADPTAASYYLTFSRLAVEGVLEWEGERRSVRGQAWMDHEISSSQLDAGQVGWDWAGIQLDDGREIMAYRMRRQDGTTDPFSQLAWVDREGHLTTYDAERFTWTGLRSWTSPITGGTYPVVVALQVTDPATQRPVTLTLEPLRLEQELRGTLGGIPYWEGACRVLDANGQAVGSAYLELTGYAGSLAARFR